VIYKLRCDIAHRGSLVITDGDYIQFVVRMSYNEFSDPIPLSQRVWAFMPALYVLVRSEDMAP
jgi:hypothetical protein